MKCGATILTGILCGLTLAAQARPANDAPPAAEPADASGEPYGAIWLRNVFDLKPAPPPPTHEATNETAPPPNVKLTGITTIFGKKMALFSVQPQAERGKPPGKEVSYMIEEGERRDGLEVVEIMPKERKVTIKLDDLVSTITFPTNSSPPTGGPPGARPGFAPPPGLTAPGFTPPGAPGFPRPLRTGGPVPQGNNNYSNPGYSPAGYGGGYSGNNGIAQGGYVAPAGTTGAAGGSALSSAFTSAAPQLNAAPVTPVLTAEQQQAAIAITHQALMEAGTPEAVGMASILPPVPGVTDTPNANNSSSGEGTPSPPQVPQTPFGTTINGHKVY